MPVHATEVAEFVFTQSAGHVLAAAVLLDRSLAARTGRRQASDSPQALLVLSLAVRRLPSGRFHMPEGCVILLACVQVVPWNPVRVAVMPVATGAPNDGLACAGRMDISRATAEGAPHEVGVRR